MPAADPAGIPALAERLVALRKTEEALRRELEAEPRYETVGTGRTFAETWADIYEGDIAAQRDVLASLVGEVIVARATDPGAPTGTRRLRPLEERVTILGPEDV
jgi:hypothetical protein